MPTASSRTNNARKFIFVNSEENESLKGKSDKGEETKGGGTGKYFEVEEEKRRRRRCHPFLRVFARQAFPESEKESAAKFPASLGIKFSFIITVI